MSDLATPLDDSTNSTPGGATPPADSPPPAPPADDALPGDDPPGSDALGDAGKKALDAMKADRNTAREDARKAREEVDALRAQIEGREKEHAAEQERRAVEQAALSKANERIVSAELRAAAKGKVDDAALADLTLYINPSDFEVGDDGSVNGSEITSAISDLITNRPYLAVQDGKRFQGDADAFTRKEARPAQLSQSDLDRMSPEEIGEARKKGQLDDLLGIRR